MAEIIDPASGLALGDSEFEPFLLKDARDPGPIESALSRMILSPSGWRAVFADPDAPRGRSAAFGPELDDSLSPSVPGPLAVIACCAAAAFARRLRRATASSRPPRVCVAVDTRPTGPAIANAVIRGLLAAETECEYAFIAAAPEIMAHARARGGSDSPASERIDGFVYVSASHNPPGHNGLKFGLADGGVLSAAESDALLAEFRALLASSDERVSVSARALGFSGKPLSSIFASAPAAKRRAKSDYLVFAREVVSGCPDGEGQERFFDALSAGLAARPLGVLAEMNGSARGLSIDEDFLSSAGLRVRLLNAAPRAFAHRIVPEGSSLDACREEMDRINADEPEFSLGYVPDCDGDRGNLVWFHPVEEEACPLGAQETFALACLAELARLDVAGAFDRDEAGVPRARVAVVVNDATSLRIEAVARAFGAEVIRAETGEANVVEAAAAARAKGAVVRVVGEGSNGGCIVHPSRVRDPLATVVSIAALLAMPSPDGSGTPFQRWLDRSRQAGLDVPELAPADATLADVLPTLPPFATTPAFEPRAARKVSCPDQAALKRAFQRVFEREWPALAPLIRERFGCDRWIAVASSGPGEIRGVEDFGAHGNGGLRVEFLASGSEEARAFFWMRGSRTEPVFRLVADVAGGRGADEEFLFSRLERMFEEADRDAVRS